MFAKVAVDSFLQMECFTLACLLCSSNLSEKSLCRVVVGPTAVKICSGLFHRLQMIQHVARLYDYSPYSTPKPGMTDMHVLYFSGIAEIKMVVKLLQ
jgi:hypothetical protein